MSANTGVAFMGFAPSLRRFTFTTHVTSSVGWIGAVLVFLALAAVGLSSQDERTVRGAYLVMAPAAWLVLVPLAHASLLSGIALSLGTPWGLFRHYWVVLKLLITAFSTVILMIYMGTFRQMAGVAADPVVELGLVRDPSPMVHAVLALTLLVAATVLAIYKPFGMTPYGSRKMAERGETTMIAGPAKPVFSPNPAGTLAWPYVAAAVSIIALLFLLLHRAGMNMHH
jgi:hypothetical protein